LKERIVWPEWGGQYGRAAGSAPACVVAFIGGAAAYVGSRPTEGSQSCLLWAQQAFGSREHERLHPGRIVLLSAHVRLVRIQTDSSK